MLKRQTELKSSFATKKKVFSNPEEYRNQSRASYPPLWSEVKRGQWRSEVTGAPFSPETGATLCTNFFLVSPPFPAFLPHWWHHVGPTDAGGQSWGSGERTGLGGAGERKPRPFLCLPWGRTWACLGPIMWRSDSHGGRIIIWKYIHWWCNC